MNGKEPVFTDAVGNYVARPLVPPRVASPINLLNPDRYEFYTFNDDGELVKRLMTMEEIQSIVANGDSEQQPMAKNPSGSTDSNEANIRDIVNNVQKVLHKEMATNQNFTANLMYNKLDTPDTSSSWSAILPAIFGNTGEPVVSNRPSSSSQSTTAADSFLMHTTTTSKKPLKTTGSTSTSTKTTAPPKSTTKVSNKQKPKPSSSSSVSSSTSTTATHRPQSTLTQKVRYPSTATTATSSSTKFQSSTKNTPPPTNKYQYSSSSQTPTFTPKPTKHVTAIKPSTHASKPTTTNQLQKISTYGVSSTLSNLNRITAAALNTIASQKPLQSVGTKGDSTLKRPISLNKYTASLKTSATTPTASSSSYTTKIRTEPPTSASTKKYYITDAPTTVSSSYPSSQSQSTKKKTSTATTSKLKTSQKSTTKIPNTTYKYIEPIGSSHSTKKFATAMVKSTTTTAPITTRKSISSQPYTTTYYIPDSNAADALALNEPEPDNIFDSELSLNQIIESLKDLEGTTMPYAQNYVDFVESTTTNTDNTMQPFEKVNTEAVTIYNNGQDLTTKSYSDPDLSKFKQSMSHSVSYIPQTTIDNLPYPSSTAHFNRIVNFSDVSFPTVRSPVAMAYVGIQHKEGSDEMENMADEQTTTEAEMDITTTDSSHSKQQLNGMDNLLRESFDSVLMQIRNEGLTTVSEDYNGDETTTYSPMESTKMPLLDRKKVIVKPTPYIPELEEGKVTEPMKYFETVIKHYEQEKNRIESASNSTVNTSMENELKTLKTTQMPIESEMETTEADLIQSTTDMASNDEQSSTTIDISTTEEEPSQTTVQESLAQSSEESVALTTELSTEETSTSEEIQSENLLKISIDTAEEATSTAASQELSTNDYYRDSTEESHWLKTIPNESEEMFSTRANEDFTSTTAFANEESASEFVTESENQSTMMPVTNDESLPEDDQTKYEMVQLIENISKTMVSDEKMPNIQNSAERKEDSDELEVKTTESSNQTVTRDENEFSNLGEAADLTTTIMPEIEPMIPVNDTLIPANVKTPIKNAINKVQSTLENLKATHPTLPPILNNLKMKVVNALKNTYTINLDPAPKQALGLEESTASAGEDILEFTKFCNELAFNFWNVLNNDGISSARSLSMSPFALTAMLSMLFLGARGRTSTEINDMLHLDDIVTFNPHGILRNITESVDSKSDPNVYTNAFVRELLSDRSKGKMLSFYKDKVHQFYSGYVEEVNFSTVNDIIRRRTNLLIKKYTVGKVNEYLKASNVWVKPPLSGVSANVFETDCSSASKEDRDGEMFFQVLPAIRQRRLVPIPAAVWKAGFTAGYDPGKCFWLKN